MQIHSIKTISAIKDLLSKKTDEKKSHFTQLAVPRSLLNVQQDDAEE